MKVVTLLSGGIDSPVAAYLMSKTGSDVTLLFMDNRPFADDDQIEKVKLLAKRLKEETGKEFPLYQAPHGIAQKIISEGPNKSYQCVLCKRTMLLTAKEFCKKAGADAIVMGDSLGQVASQTLKNILSCSADLNFLVLRPLIGFDKLEIEKIAKEIGTYEISIMPSQGCTALPDKVVTESDFEKTKQYSTELDIENVAIEQAKNAILID